MGLGILARQSFGKCEHTGSDHLVGGGGIAGAPEGRGGPPALHLSVPLGGKWQGAKLGHLLRPFEVNLSTFLGQGHLRIGDLLGRQSPL